MTKYLPSQEGALALGSELGEESGMLLEVKAPGMGGLGERPGAQKVLAETAL